MSLLLDALKKAADDKQRLSDGQSLEQSTGDDVIDEGTIIADKEAPDISPDSDSHDAELSLQEIQDVDIREPVDPDEKKDTPSPELTLDSLDSQGTVEIHERRDEREHRKLTVSNDALSMLIHKTNHDVKKSRRIQVASIMMAGLLVLISGAVYYYIDMQTEMKSLEQKHRIAMQAMHSKMNREHLPSNPKVIHNLVASVEREKEIKLDREQAAGNRSSEKVRAKDKAKPDGLRSQGQYVPGLSIQRTNKSDPVGEQLDAAWLLYEKGQYSEAEKLYEKVISQEKNNRDALLGLGAIAVLEKDNTRAGKIYNKLLEQDPRDPVATAAIANLRNDPASLKSDEDYLLSMLEKNSSAPHLNFSLGNIYAQQNKWASAQQYYFNAWQQDSDNADYIFNLAVSLDQLNKKEQALRFYKDCLSKAKNRQVSFSREMVQQRIHDLSGL